MSFDPIKPTVHGNIVTRPERRVIPNTDVEIASFRIAVDEGYFDRQQGEDVKTGTAYIECSAKGALGRNILASDYVPGTRVVAVGKLTAKAYVRKDGTADPGLRLALDDLGPSNLFTPVTVPTREKRERPRGREDRQAPPPEDPYAYDSSNDPWPVRSPGGY